MAAFLGLIKDDAIYPCSGCGACCKRIDKVEVFLKLVNDPKNELSFPYTWDETGRCEKLTDDNKCSVYEDRPLVCNMDRLMTFLHIPKQEFYEKNIKNCNSMMDQDGIAKEFRIKLSPPKG